MPRGAEQPQLRHPPIRIYSFLGWAFNVEQVQRLRYLKWIGTYTALALISEVGDFRRFPSTRAFMAFLGLVPSEHSSGGRRRTGGITKTGNSFLRALLIEASWHYAYPKRSSEKLRRKRKGQPGQVAAYAARASERFHRVYRKLSFRRHNGKVAVVAVAWGGEAGL
jgi:transposase